MAQVLCIDRKFTVDTPKDRQAAFVNRFREGCDGRIVSVQEAYVSPIEHPWCIRGMKFTAAVDRAWREGRTFYYIDNAYFGNPGRKVYFRIIKDHVHDIRPVIPRDRARLDRCEILLKPFTPGGAIVVAPPSGKSFSLWNINQQQWIDDTVNEIRKHTDRPIRIRLKRTREDRMAHNTMEQELANDVHCLVTYNSVSAVEAIMLGKPAITLGPNAAGVLCSKTLSEIENPKIPTLDEREAWLRHLSYSQFTFTEMSDGTAWRTLNQS